MTFKFLDIFSHQYEPVARSFYSYLSTTEYVAIKRTCKGLYSAATAYEKVVYDINAHLQPFFQDPRKFRTILGECGAIVSGSHALQFLTKETWICDNLDIMVLEPRYLLRMANYLETEGYLCAPDSGQIWQPEVQEVG